MPLHMVGKQAAYVSTTFNSEDQYTYATVLTETYKQYMFRMREQAKRSLLNSSTMTCVRVSTTVIPSIVMLLSDKEDKFKVYRGADATAVLETVHPLDSHLAMATTVS